MKIAKMHKANFITIYRIINTKRVGRFSNHSDNNDDNNNDSSNSPSYFDELASLYHDISWKPSLDHSRPLFLRHRHTSFEKVLAYADKRIQKSRKVLDKLRLRKVAYANRAKTIPENATIRKEYIKCGKENCEEPHGPYYYAYWKHPQSKKLNKKYIGSHVPENKEELKDDGNNNQRI